MVTRGVPCLRRATSLAYTDADEDAERLLSFGDSTAAGNEADEWVETHAGRRANADSDANPRVIDDIPDLDGPHEDDGISGAAANLSLSDTPDLDDIPDMEEDLEDGDDAAAAPSKAPPPPRKSSDATFVPMFRCILLDLTYSKEGRRGYEREPTLGANVRCHDHL
jgi:ubiquitin-like-conjugating enzyme ATG3